MRKSAILVFNTTKGDFFMYEINVSMKEPQYRNLMYWALFCRNPILTILMLLIYGYGLLTLTVIVKNISQFQDSMMMTLFISVLCLVMPIFVITSHEKRIRKVLGDGDIENRTRRKITITPKQITVLRIAKNESSSYTWNDVQAVYQTKDGLVMFLKNKQAFPIYSATNQPEALDLIRQTAKENNAFKWAIPGRLIWILLLLVTFLSMLLGG